MRILITGVAGFLGSHLAEKLLGYGFSVVGIDNLIGGDKDNVPEVVEFYKMNLCDYYTIRPLFDEVDVVYHCAATAYEGLSVFSPTVVTENIVQASVSVFTACVDAKVKRIVNMSSMARYGAQSTPFTENMTPKPQDPYGIGKVASEKLLKNICEVHGVQWVNAVPHNIIGIRQKYDDPYRNVVAIMINRILQGKPPIVYGDGEQKRCFSPIQDVIEPLVVMGFSEKVLSETINIGPDEGEITINELVEILKNIIGGDFKSLYYPDRPQEVKVAVCNSDKSRELLDYRPLVAIEDSIQEMVDYIKDKGAKPFNYHLPIEIANKQTPRTWLREEM